MNGETVSGAAAELHHGESAPEGWIRTTLGEILEGIEAGRSFLCDERPPADNEVGVVKISAVTWGKYDELQSKTCTKPELVERRFFINEGDLLISRANTVELVGACVIAEDVKRKVMLSDKVLRLNVRAPFGNRWVLQYLRSREGRSQIQRLATGNQQSMRNIGQDRLKSIVVPVAPLAEQHRILERIAALLARVETARNRLTRVSAILKRFRQSVLAAACAGRLTDEWRAERQRSDAWPEVSLGSVAIDVSYGSSTKSASQGSVPVLRMGNIQNGKLDWEDLMYTSTAEEIGKYSLSPGDVLFNRTNSPELVGKTAVYRGEQAAIFAGYLIRVRCGDQLLPDYLNYCLNSLMGREYCNHVKTDGVSQSNINARKLAAFSFGLPSVQEQTEIVHRVDKLLGMADLVGARIGGASAMVNGIASAILAKAFAGELVRTEDALSREGGLRYESARELLERVRGPGKEEQREEFPKKPATRMDSSRNSLDR